MEAIVASDSCRDVAGTNIPSSIVRTPESNNVHLVQRMNEQPPRVRACGIILLVQSRKRKNVVMSRELLVGRHFCRVWRQHRRRDAAVMLLSHDSILISDECLTMQLEGFAHELGYAIAHLLVGGLPNFTGRLIYVPPNDHFIDHTAP